MNITCFDSTSHYLILSPSKSSSSLTLILLKSLLGGTQWASLGLLAGVGWEVFYRSTGAFPNGSTNEEGLSLFQKWLTAYHSSGMVGGFSFLSSPWWNVGGPDLCRQSQLLWVLEWKMLHKTPLWTSGPLASIHPPVAGFTGMCHPHPICTPTPDLPCYLLWCLFCSQENFRNIIRVITWHSSDSFFIQTSTDVDFPLRNPFAVP